MDPRQLRALILRHAPVPDGDDAPLKLDSLTLVLIVEDLELSLGRRVRASEITAENFGSIAAIVRWIG